MRTLTSIPGNSQRLDGGAMFGNAPRALWSRWIAPDEANRIPLACRCLLIRDPHQTVLLEAGIGVFFEPKLRDRFGVVEEEHVLLRSLTEAGVDPAEVDVVVLSHLHFDHAGGLLSPWREDGHFELVFPRARFLVGLTAWERACNPHFRDRASFVPMLNDRLVASGRLEVVEGNTSKTLGSGFTFHRSDGHTPGLLITEVAMPGGPVVFVADLAPGCPWVHLPITMGYDRYPEQLIGEKEVLFTDLVARGGRLFYTHDPTVALSGIERDQRGRFHPVDPVSSLRELDH
ncbi:MAG: MBL fold metallo-hydrolase [Deltaproteobacteria bacterium]|nr:MBL fold metallo-hydrolase [Deltaproteobacteria bacterium]